MIFPTRMLANPNCPRTLSEWFFNNLDDFSIEQIDDDVNCLIYKRGTSIVTANNDVYAKVISKLLPDAERQLSELNELCRRPDFTQDDGDYLLSQMWGLPQKPTSEDDLFDCIIDSTEYGCESAYDQSLSVLIPLLANGCLTQGMYRYLFSTFKTIFEENGDYATDAFYCDRTSHSEKSWFDFFEEVLSSPLSSDDDVIYSLELRERARSEAINEQSPELMLSGYFHDLCLVLKAHPHWAERIHAELFNNTEGMTAWSEDYDILFCHVLLFGNLSNDDNKTIFNQLTHHHTALISLTLTEKHAQTFEFLTNEELNEFIKSNSNLNKVLLQNSVYRITDTPLLRSDRFTEEVKAIQPIYRDNFILMQDLSIKHIDSLSTQEASDLAKYLSDYGSRISSGYSEAQLTRDMGCIIKNKQLSNDALSVVIQSIEYFIKRDMLLAENICNQVNLTGDQINKLSDLVGGGCVGFHLTSHRNCPIDLLVRLVNSKGNNSPLKGAGNFGDSMRILSSSECAELFNACAELQKTESVKRPHLTSNMDAIASQYIAYSIYNPYLSGAAIEQPLSHSILAYAFINFSITQSDIDLLQNILTIDDLSEIKRINDRVHVPSDLTEGILAKTLKEKTESLPALNRSPNLIRAL